MTTINLLKENEVKLFESPPKFTGEERARYFVLPDDVKFRKIETKIGYILQEGYFLSQQKFFLPNQYHNEDIEYVTKLCGVKRYIDVKKLYNKFAYNRWKQFILHRYGYKSFSSCRALFEEEARELARSASKPKEIFYDLVDFLAEKTIEIAGYYIFAEVITKALNIFENESIKIVDNALTAEQKELLDGFMYMPVDSSRELSSKNPYLITHLKKAEQAVAPLKIKESLTDFHHIKELHENLSRFFTSNLISNELINYYAVWMLKAEHTQFDDISDIQNKRLYVTSFISYQYKMRQDYFMDAFLQAIQKYYNDTEKNIARRFLDQNLKYNKQEQMGKIHNIISGTREQLHKIREIVYSVSLDDSKKMKLILDILDKAGLGSHDEILDELDKLENTGAKSLKNQLLYEELSRGYRRLSNRVAGNIARPGI
jgi:hypothetical protein